MSGDDPFTVMLLDKKGWPLRTITVKARSDVSVINTSRGAPGPGETGDHFRLYEQLSGAPVDFATPAAPPQIAQPFPGELPAFTSPRPATDVLGCSPVKP